MKKWSTEELETAITLLKKGKKFSEIASKLNRTTKAIRVYLNRLGYYFKDYLPINEIIITKCSNCEKEFESKLNDNRIYCSQRCSALKLNFSKKKFKKCHNCNNNISSRNKYCSQKCQQLFQRNEIYKKIENNDYQFSDVKTYKNYLIEKHGEKCMICEWKEVNPLSGKIPIELHHVDGNSDNNKLENLQLLCPNHHALTKSWKVLNSGAGRYSKRREKRRERYKNGKSC